MTNGTAVIALHGGLDTSRSEKHMEVMKEAVLAGSRLIEAGRLPALEAAINVLEDSPLFNCGYGSVLNAEGPDCTLKKQWKPPCRGFGS